jgi:hypothetical protein
MDVSISLAGNQDVGEGFCQRCQLVYLVDTYLAYGRQLYELVARGERRRANDDDES